MDTVFSSIQRRVLCRKILSTRTGWLAVASVSAEEPVGPVLNEGDPCVWEAVCSVDADAPISASVVRAICLSACIMTPLHSSPEISRPEMLRSEDEYWWVRDRAEFERTEVGEGGRVGA